MYSSRSIQKRLFQDFIDFFRLAPIFLGQFSDKSSLLGNLFRPFKRSSQSLPIPMVFGVKKKSSTVSINRFINLLTLVVRNCTHSYPSAGTDRHTDVVPLNCPVNHEITHVNLELQSFDDAGSHAG